MSKLNIGIIQGSVREERNGIKVAEYILEKANLRNDANYELVDLADYDLPLLGSKNATEAQAKDIVAWKAKLAEFDAYVFITPEYNHALGGALKNATDYIQGETANKAAGFVGYGSLGGTRAHENMRLILAELQVATVRTAVTFSFMSDFENFSDFKPADYHQANIDGMLDQVNAWATALKTLRN